MSDDFEDITTTQVEEKWDESPTQNFRRPPNPGIYPMTRLDEGFKAGTFEMKDNGEKCAYFMFRGQINGGVFDGRLAFGSVSTMRPRLEGRTRSSLQDFVLSAKSTLPRTLFNTPALLAEVAKNEGDDTAHYTVQRIVGPFLGKVDWEWRDDSETFLKGGKNPKPPKKWLKAHPKDPKPKVRKLADGSIDHIQISPAGTEVCATPTITDFIVKAPGSVTVPNTTVQAPVAAADLPPSAG